MKEDENIELSNVSAAGTRIYGLSSIAVAVANIDDGSGNWGLLINVVFDYPVTGVEDSYAAFLLTDANNIVYSCNAASVSGDGMTVTLSFTDFNLAEGTVCNLTYTPGSVYSPVVPLSAFSFEFTPVNLVAPQIDPPEPEELWNE
jgi:hypothetical protein